MKFFYTYVLESKKDKRSYIGWTDDLIARYKKHKLGHVKATRDRRPLLLVYYEACQSKQRAIEREKQLKTGFGRSFLKKRI